MARYNVGLVPGTAGVPTAMAIVEYGDDASTLNLSRTHGIREVVSLAEHPAGMARAAIIEKIAEDIVPLGDGARVVYSTGGSQVLRDNFYEAYRGGLLFSRPTAVTIVTGEQLATDSLGYRIGDSELVKSLQEQVRIGGFKLPAGEESILRAAMAMQVDVAPAGQIRLPVRKDDGLVLALALALYPRFAPPHGGRRYRPEPTPRHPVPAWLPSYQAATDEGYQR